LKAYGFCVDIERNFLSLLLQKVNETICNYLLDKPAKALEHIDYYCFLCDAHGMNQSINTDELLIDTTYYDLMSRISSIFFNWI